MNLTVLDELQQADQYTRLDVAQQHIDQLQSQDVEFLLQRVQGFADQGDLETAADLADVAMLCALVLDDQMTLARTLTVQAQVLFAIGDHRRGIHCSLQTTNLLKWQYKSFYEIRDFFEEHEFDFGIALADEKIALGLDPLAAIQILDEVEKVYEYHGYELGLGHVYVINGDACKEILKLEDALISYMRALPILRKYKMHTAELLLNLSNVCSGLNQYSEAEAYLDEAEKIFEQEENELGLAAIYVNRAVFLRRKRQHRNVVRLYRKAYEIHQRHQQVQEAAFVDMNVGTLLLTYPGHYEQSLTFLEAALAAFEEDGNKRLAAKARGYVAALYYSTGAPDRAKSLFLQIIGEDPTEIPTDTLWEAYYNLGLLERSEGKLEEAYRYHQNAVEIIESMRMYLRTEELFIDILNLKPDFYGPLISLAKQLRKTPEAFSWVEHARSRAFLQILGNTRPPVPTDQDSTLLADLDDLDAKIVILRRTIDERATVESPATVSRWQEAWREANAMRETLRRRLKIQNAEAAFTVLVQPLDWDGIRCLLEPD